MDARLHKDVSSPAVTSGPPTGRSPYVDSHPRIIELPAIEVVPDPDPSLPQDSGPDTQGKPENRDPETRENPETRVADTKESEIRESEIRESETRIPGIQRAKAPASRTSPSRSPFGNISTTGTNATGTNATGTNATGTKSAGTKSAGTKSAGTPVSVGPVVDDPGLGPRHRSGRGVELRALREKLTSFRRSRVAGGQAAGSQANREQVRVDREQGRDDHRNWLRLGARRPDPAEYQTAKSWLAIQQVAGHLTITASEATAWYRLPAAQWEFVSDTARNNLLLTMAAQYAQLHGMRLHLRTTTRPFDSGAWAQSLHSNTPDQLPDVPGATTWGEFLQAGQLQLQRRTGYVTEAYVGVTFQKRTLREQAVGGAGRLRGRGSIGQAERARLEKLVKRFDQVLGGVGLNAQRVTPEDLEWLLHRSIGLCLPPPEHLFPVTGTWGPEDLHVFTDRVHREYDRWGRTCRLTAVYGSQHVTRHVAILSLGRTEELSIPERHDPWMHAAEWLPWPVEVSSRVNVLAPEDAARSLESRLLVIRNNQRDYREHDLDSPPELDRLARRAMQLSDDLRTGREVDMVRMHGWHRMAVAGDTEEECLSRVNDTIAFYREHLRMELVHSLDQPRLLREFVPGEALVNNGYLRRMPAVFFAAGLPQASSQVGDDRGPLIGETAGASRRPVMFDPHYPMERRRKTGLAVLVAEPGGGKSVLAAGISALAARRGVLCTVLDPSGPLSKLVRLPELAPFARELDLTRGEPGTLAPYALIPTPRRDQYRPGAAGDKEFEQGVSEARAERRALAIDTATMLCPAQVARALSTPVLLQRAARDVAPEESSTLEDLLAALNNLGAEGKELADTISDVSDYPLSRLFFGRPPPDILGGEAMLTVITMSGMPLPDLTIDREYWSLRERMALPMLHLASLYTARRAYGRPMDERKLVFLDEAHFLNGWGSGRALFTRLSRDSRKWNIATLLATQNPSDILGLDLNNLVSTVFVGRIVDDEQLAEQAIRLLRIQKGIGYETVLARLSEDDPRSAGHLPWREFVMRDVDGRVGKIRVDWSYVPGLLDALRSDADPHRAHRGRTAPALAAPAPAPSAPAAPAPAPSAPAAPLREEPGVEAPVPAESVAVGGADNGNTDNGNTDNGNTDNGNTDNGNTEGTAKPEQRDGTEGL
jgi:hypothetical protein